MIRKRILIGTVLVILVLGLLPVSSLAAPEPAPGQQDQTNLAVNPGFEGLSCRPESKAPECLDNWTHDVHWPDEPVHENIFTPQGWVTWWRRGGDYGQPEVKTIPNVAPFTGELPRIRSGYYATLLFTFYRLQDMGLYQCVSAEAGSTVEMTAYAHGWSCDESGGSKMGYSCGDPYNQAFRVGIEPNGVADPFAPSVVWSEKTYAPDHYKLIGPVSAQVGEGGSVCIFLRSNTKWQYKYADAYWDDVSLVQTAAGAPPTNTPPPPPPPATEGPPPTPLPTPTPRPDGAIVYVVQSGDTLSLIAQKTGVAVDQIRNLNASSIGEGYIIHVGQELVLSLPSEAPDPTEAPTEEPQVVADAGDAGDGGVGEGGVTGGGTGGGGMAAGTSICVLAYHDRNGDTFRDEANEELLPNAQFTLANVSGVVDQYTSDGINEPYCFASIAPDSYRVVQDPPPGYAVSGAAEQAVAVTEGASINVAFGYVRSDDATAPDTPAEEAGTDGGSSGVRSVFSTIAKVSGVLVLLLCAGVAVLFVLNRRRMM
jgi:LysM repeat protein